QMIALEDDATQNIFRKLHVALDAGDLGAFALEEGKDVNATFLAADFVGEAAFVPLADVENFGVGAVQNMFNFRLGGLPGAGGVGGIEEEKSFVLTCVRRH